MSRFPCYQSAGIAARWGCFSCCKPLDPETLKDAGYALGDGKYLMQCQHCNLSTFFDLEMNLEQS